MENYLKHQIPACARAVSVSGSLACSMYHGTSDRACGGTVVE